MKYILQFCDLTFLVNCAQQNPLIVQSIEFLKDEKETGSEHLPEIILELKKALKNTLMGGNTDFSEQYLSFDSFSQKEIQVLKALRKVPRGSVVSYSSLGEQAGLGKNSARFVGNVMAKNPYPILFPCHRVIKKNGQLGNYTGGKELKKKLLLREGLDKFYIL